MQRSVLVVEDEQEIADLISFHLKDAGYSVTHAGDGVAGLSLALTQQWDLILLDLSLPRVDGIEICRQVRQCSSDTPIILVTARTAEPERIQGLDAGADDYVTKPFSVLELVARIRAIFRRVSVSSERQEQEVVTAGDIVLNKRSHEASVAGNSLCLTPKEFDLLMFFAHSPGQVFKRQELLEKIWGYQNGVYMHTVNSHINRLRAKIEDDPSDPKYIKTVWGVGYKFNDSLE
ncbi:MAG: response regulator transcription factor [Granulosicoccus sp.]|nr:response regulator transcription factor [Granulosicoccus sp.]